MKVLVGFLVAVAIVYLSGWSLVLGSKAKAIAGASPGFMDRTVSPTRRAENKEWVEEWREEHGLPKAAPTDSKREELARTRQEFNAVLASLYYEDAFETVQESGWTCRSSLLAIRIADKPWGFIQIWRFLGPYGLNRVIAYGGLVFALYFLIRGVVFQCQGRSLKTFFGTVRWPVRESEKES